jgi:hypothetical protein
MKVFRRMCGIDFGFILFSGLFLQRAWRRMTAFWITIQGMYSTVPYSGLRIRIPTVCIRNHF